MSRQPTSKAGRVPTQGGGKPQAKPVAATAGARPAVPTVKQVSQPPPAKVAATKPASAGGSSPGTKPPAAAKPPPVVAKVPQVPPATPSQPRRPPPVVKPATKASAPSGSNGLPVGPSPMQAPAPPPSKSVPAAEDQWTQLSTIIWPCGVPGMEEAGRLLGGVGSQGKHDEAIEGLWNTLTDVEPGALLGRPSPVDLSTLKEAVIVRWRLGHALETKPAKGTPIEMEALERLLSEADVALTCLQAPDEATEPVREAFNSARAALAKHAVALSNIAAEFAQQAAAAAAANKATKKYEQVARLVASGADTAKWALRSKLLWAGLAVSVLGAAGFHGYRYLRAKDAPVGASYSAAGLYGFKNESTGIAVLQWVDPTKSVDPAALAQLKAQAEANGKTVHEVGPGQYVVAPSRLLLGDSASEPAKGQR